MSAREYLVRYRPDTVGADLTSIIAYRVESWRSSFAFFNNPRDLSEPTTLVPNDIVQDVRAHRIVPPGVTAEYDLQERAARGEERED